MDSSTHEVPTADAISFAQAKAIDFIETSALTGENVENAFRRLVLSVAVLLPPVRVHMSLTGLPDGWISVNFKDGGADLSSVASRKPEGDGDTVKDTPSSSGKCRSMYCNYWTGELFETFPSTPAETGLLYLAIRNSASSGEATISRT